MFDTSVVGVFEEATGVRLKREHYPDLDRLRTTHPVVRQMPRVENYSSSEAHNDRLGGHFTVRLYFDGRWPDEGVRNDTGLERWLPERGPGGYHVSASARRANVEVMFWGDTSEITPEAATTWALLTTCLSRLSPGAGNVADSAETDTSRTRTGLWVLALALAVWRWRKARNP